MKTTIFYFSGTGNTLSIAKKLAAKLGETALVSIPEAIHSGIDCSADRIGIIFPVYAFGCPAIIERFLKIFKAPSGKYLFVIYNSAGGPGAAGYQANWLLSQNGVQLSAMFSLKMPGNYIPLAGAQSEAAQQKIFRKTDEKLQEIADFIMQNKVKQPVLAKSILGRIFMLIHEKGIKSIHKADRKFYTNEKCVKCGLCAKVCPVCNISTEKTGAPEWLGRCEQCMACLQWCPNQAIEYGKISVKRKRYHHPDITARDIMVIKK